jgi:transposase-like protein
MSRRRYTEEQKRKLLAELSRSGGSARAFARERGLSYKTLLGWRRKREAGELAAADFVELEVQPASEVPKRQAADPAVELILAGGSVLRIYPSQPCRP